MPSNSIPHLRQASVLFLLLFFNLKPVLGDVKYPTVSLAAETSYQALRDCARNCFYWGGNFAGEFGTSYLSCHSPVENRCACRADLIQTGADRITGCVSSACGGNSVDMDEAKAVYTNYCLKNGYTMKAPPTEPGPTPTATGSSPAAATVTVVLQSNAVVTRPPILLPLMATTVGCLVLFL